MAAVQGNISGWKKGEGDEIAAGDVLAEVETDKATMDWEAQVRPIELFAAYLQADRDPISTADPDLIPTPMSSQPEAEP